mmetsp:Transcript_11425/g.20670  ORF Transcript_11425/g.20670 Transcript_11425/m.20670 type:complete len:208 (-) Transcript_11425:245-868(-)
MAENIGGTWWMSPKNLSRATNNSASVMCSHGEVASTADSLSYDGVLSPRRRDPVYSFSCAMKVSTCLVPFPTHTMTSPVAIGSSVPACPTFLIFSAPLSLPHRSNEVHSCGLSISTIAFCHVSMLGGSVGGGGTRQGSGGSFFFRCCCCCWAGEGPMLAADVAATVTRLLRIDAAEVANRKVRHGEPRRLDARYCASLSVDGHVGVE